MPMRRTIGISLACSVTSACGVATASEESTTPYPGDSTGLPGNAEMPTDRSRCFTCGAAQERRSAGHGSKQMDQQRATFGAVATTCGGVRYPCCDPMRAAGRSQFGEAAWYDFEGGRTASGERLDTVTATAAHRLLPLTSYAKVTNLDQPLGHRQNQRPRPIRSRTYHRPLAACCRRARHQACRCGGRRH
jgi:rare lipoprotein A (peptidoglycan hydrolase)